MPANWTQIEREEESIQRDYEEGLISSAEAARQMRELQRDVQAAAEEEAERACVDALEGW